MNNLSPWFDLSEQKPWQPGVYLVHVEDEPNLKFWSYWDGAAFNYRSCLSASSAFNRRHLRGGGGLVSKWRGLASPIQPEHLARRTDPQTSKDAAVKSVKSGLVTNHCDLIRAMLQEYGPQNANEVGARIGLHAHQVMKRFSDLRKIKLASRTGEVRQGQSVWNAI